MDIPNRGIPEAYSDTDKVAEQTRSTNAFDTGPTAKLWVIHNI